MFAFLIGLIGLKYNYFSLIEVVIIGVLAVVIDIDHLISFYRHHKSWDLLKCWNGALEKHEYLWTFIHHRFGMIVVTGILALVSLFNIKYALIPAIAYYSHMILDHMHLHKHKIKGHDYKEVFGLAIPLCYSEFVFDFLLLVSIIFLFLY